MNQTIEPTPTTAADSRRWWTAGGVALFVLVIVGSSVDRCAERSGRPAAFAGAHRIWLSPSIEAGEHARHARGPLAFWAVKDFELSAEQVERGSQSARLLVLGDPEVLVYWNGMLVRSQTYRQGQSIRSLNVGALLEAGNRVVLEARSISGAGGLMAALWLELPSEGAPTGEPVWVTDSSWQATREFDSALLQGLVPLSEVTKLEPVRAWKKLDLGRWRPLVVVEQPEQLSWPSRRLSRTAPLEAVRHPSRPVTTGESEPWPAGVVYSFAAPVQGCLGVSGTSLFSRRIFFLESSSVLSDTEGPTEVARASGQGPAAMDHRVIPMPGALRWFAASPQRFSAILLEGNGAGEPSSDGTVWVQPCATAAEPSVNRRLHWRRL